MLQQRLIHPCRVRASILSSSIIIATMHGCTLYAVVSYMQMLELLLDRGAPVDMHNKTGWTALHRAAFNGRVEACRLLLRRGASIHAVTKSGCTALHLAASNNHLGVMELLLQLGASTHMK